MSELKFAEFNFVMLKCREMRIANLEFSLSFEVDFGES